MSPSSDDGSPPFATQARQPPGSACEECRRRKLRCDGRRPRCGVCQESGALCEVNTHRALRGPKKGYLKALENRVATLESRLVEEQQAARNIESNALATSLADQQTTRNIEPNASVTPSSNNQMARSIEPNALPTPLTDLSEGPTVSAVVDFHQPPIQPRSASDSEPEICFPNLLPGISMSSLPRISAISYSNNHISELMQAELDQLYFDRVHTSIQIIHQRRYMSWSRHSAKKTSRICLQYAMWTLATLLSAQFQHLQDFLYQGTKQMLESLTLDSTGGDAIETELIQAWVLIATYESMRTYHQQAWMSAGRAFRLVQLMRLHEIDVPTNGTVPESDFIETEEKRRVFWNAYFLDHLFSMRNNWPITLNEHVICTRLPASEVEFQNGRPVPGGFLSEAITEHSPRVRSAFNELVVLATICGRILFHGQQCNVSCAYGDVAPASLDQHRWLDSILTSRLQILSQYYPSPMETCDSMLLFANIMGQATLIYLCKGMESVLWAIDEGKTMLVEFQQRALAAAEQIINLARALTEHNIFKVHPLMPIPLLICAEFLYTNRSSQESFNLRLQDLLDILRQLKNVNDPNQNYTQLLKMSCTLASADIVKEILVT